MKSETFDAGPLAFSGTTTAITLFPPYKFQAGGGGAPFLGGAEIHVQAQGATNAGFEKFDASFTATTFLQTSPAISKLSRESVFGAGSVPIAWAPGSDSIVVTVSGPGGSATCKVQDSLGKFDLPRSVVTAAIGDVDVDAVPALTLSVARQKKDVKKDKKANGTLRLASVRPEGWLELVTVSTESTSFHGCSSGEAFCGSTCAALSSDPANCGACGNACGQYRSCAAGTCQTTTAGCSKCIQTATKATCAAAVSACNADNACTDLDQCVVNCSTPACDTQCRADYPTGTATHDAAVNCINAACKTACN